MKASKAIMTFFSLPGYNPEVTYHKPSIQEIKAFKESCSDEEYKEYGNQACQAIGETLED